MPKVSICIPVFNGAATIAETLISLKAQSFEDLEIVIVDNASTDGTPTIVMPFLDCKTRLVRNPFTVSMEKNVEVAISEARGEFIAIYHADDLYHSDIVTRQVAYLDLHPVAVAVFSCGERIDSAGNKCGDYPAPEEVFEIDGINREYNFIKILKLILRNYNFLICPTAMVRATFYRNPPRRWSDPEFNSSADLGVWLGLLENNSIGILPDKLIRVRQSAGQYSSQVRRFNTERADFFRVIDYYLSLLWVRKLIDDSDLRALALCEHKDRCLRAINWMIKGNSEAALRIINTFELTILRSVLLEAPIYTPTRYRKWWIIGLLLNVVARLPDSDRKAKFLEKFWYGRGYI
jgi:glycosyltransferase involved in cell wall biosynthesis